MALSAKNQQQAPSWVERFADIPMVYKITAMVLPLLYVVAINMELSAGSQRYTVTHHAKVSEVYTCLDKDAAIVKQMQLQKQIATTQADESVDREKLHIFSKWLNCGVF